MGVVGGCGLFDMAPPTRFNIFTGCPEAKTCTIILRGGAEQFIEETERSLHDAIMIVRRTIKNDAIVAGEWRERRTGCIVQGFPTWVLGCVGGF